MLRGCTFTLVMLAGAPPARAGELAPAAGPATAGEERLAARFTSLAFATPVHR
jgi:hypothetical protein